MIRNCNSAYRWVTITMQIIVQLDINGSRWLISDHNSINSQTDRTFYMLRFCTQFLFFYFHLIGETIFMKIMTQTTDHLYRIIIIFIRELFKKCSHIVLIYIFKQFTSTIAADLDLGLKNFFVFLINFILDNLDVKFKCREIMYFNYFIDFWDFLIELFSA